MSVAESEESDTPGSLAAELSEVAQTWARSQHRLVVLAARFADSVEWVLAGSPTAAHWLAAEADVEACTAREWIRIGRRLAHLPVTAEAFERAEVSYSKVRTLTRMATTDNEAELVAIALDVAAGELSRSIALWLQQNLTPAELSAHQQRSRSVRWRTEFDGMTVFTLRLTPRVASVLIALLTGLVMKRSQPTTLSGQNASASAWPTVAQQHADAFETLLTDRAGTIDTEVVVHVRGDGCTLDDGSPISDSDVARLVPTSFIRALIHDAEGRPINASGRQRHPTTRQKRVVKDRDQVCVDCGRSDLLVYDHVPAYDDTGHTIVDELVVRCAPCHHRRHER